MNRKLIEKAEYLLSKEKGTVFKDPGGKINIVLAYPNSYSVGMSSLGFQGIYGLLNSLKYVVCERVFLPDTKDMEEYQRTGTELFSLESKRALSRFDIIAFSVSFENDYPNILKMLNMARIPARSAERGASAPLVIMGGVCAFYNPEPLAEFFDICFVGEAEEMLAEFLDVYRNAANKGEVLRKSAGIEGLYIPSGYEITYDAGGKIIERVALHDSPVTIKKRTITDISKNVLRSAITTPEAEFSDVCLLEAMRGCPWSCRFCLAGHIYNPVRKKSLDALKDDINDSRSRTVRVGLIGPSLSDYPGMEEVLAIEGVDFSITSLRASTNSGRIVQMLRNNKSVSIAPEAGSERLREVIKKNISNKDILDTACLILGSGIETLRLYFMIGLPTETRDDIEEIVRLVKTIRRNSRQGFLTLSISTFVPKPFTPFQWHPMEQMKEIKERLKIIKQGLAKVKGIKVFHDVIKYAYMQGLFALGDRRVSREIENMLSGDEHDRQKKFPGCSRDFYIFRKKDAEEIFPWDFIDAGVSKEKLWNEYRKAIGT